MLLNPKLIAPLVYGMLACLVVGYVAWLYRLLTGTLTDPWLITVFGFHTAGMFAPLLVYFGYGLKVTLSSMEAGRQPR